MEFVIVTFPLVRSVRLDGVRQAQTGQVFGVQRGTHVFDLGNPRNYAPPSVQAQVVNTSETAPLVIGFTPLAAEVAAPEEAVVPRARRAARKKPAAPKKKKTTKKKAARTGSRRKTARKVSRRKTR
jgi:hypothetical protein